MCLRAKNIKMDGRTMTKCQKKRCAKESKEKEEDVVLLNRKSSTLFLFSSPKDIPGKPVPFLEVIKLPRLTLSISLFS